MEFAPIKDALYTWFKKTSGLDSVIWADQDGPRPARPYATLRLITGAVKLGGQDNLRVNESGVFYLNGPREITVSINVMGVSALDILTTARDSLDDPSVIDDLEADGIAIIEDGSPQNITELLETGFEERAQMDLKIGFQAERDSTAVVVTKISLNGRDLS